MIRFLLDSSGLWRIMRDDSLHRSWSNVITSGAIGSCHPQRTEFRRSARNLTEYDQMGEMFDALYPDVPVPKVIWRSMESDQYRLVRAGAHRALSVVDLLISSVASRAGLTVLHDDADFVTAASHLENLRERSVLAVPD